MMDYFYPRKAAIRQEVKELEMEIGTRRAASFLFRHELPKGVSSTSVLTTIHLVAYHIGQLFSICSCL
jgi:hypothetical protein